MNLAKFKEAFTFPATMFLGMAAAASGVGFLSHHAEKELKKHPDAVSSNNAATARADCAQKWNFLQAGLGIAIPAGQQKAALASCTAQTAYHTELNSDHVDFVQSEEIAGGIGLLFAFSVAGALRNSKKQNESTPPADAPAPKPA